MPVDHAALDPTSLAAVLEPTAVDRDYAFDKFPAGAKLVETSAAISAKRQADAAERIAASLEAIAQHLAPVTGERRSAVSGSPYPPEVDLTLQPAPDADGWIEWYGGECPVPAGTLVDFEHHDGDVYYARPAGEEEASDWSIDTSWPTPGDIVRWRLSPAR